MDQLWVGTTVRNEGPYLAEWIEFHRLQGVDHFVLFNDNSTDETVTVLEKYIRTGLVEYRPGIYQNSAQNAILEMARGRTEWLALIDADEFLFATEGERLPEVLPTYAAWPAVAVCWLLFGTSHHLCSPGLTTEHYVWRAFDTFNEHRQAKLIVQPTRCARMIDSHQVEVGSQTSWVIDEAFRRVRGAYAPRATHEVFRINHYFSRSLHECLQKWQRGYNRRGIGVDSQGKRRWWQVMHLVRNDVRDVTIQRHLPALRAALK